MSIAKSLVVHTNVTPVNIKIEREPIPIPASDFAVISILATGIGPHFKHKLSTSDPHFKSPLSGIHGNHGVGRVVSIGPNSHFALQEGQLVFVDLFVTLRDDQEVSAPMGLLYEATQRWSKKLARPWRDGCWTSHAVVPLENVFPLNEDALVNRLGCDIADLPYINRLAVAYGGISAIGLKAGETVIIGPATGHYGGAAVEVASAAGARVIALGRNCETLARLEALLPRVVTVALTGDITTDTMAIRAFGPVDAFIDFSSKTPHHIGSCIRSLRRFGRVALMGAVLGDIHIPYTYLMMKNLEIKGQWMYSREELREVIRMVEFGVLKLGKAAGHKYAIEFTLEEWEKALDAASKLGAWGEQVLFTP